MFEGELQRALLTIASTGGLDYELRLESKVLDARPSKSRPGHGLSLTHTWTTSTRGLAAERQHQLVARLYVSSGETLKVALVDSDRRRYPAPVTCDCGPPEVFGLSGEP